MEDLLNPDFGVMVLTICNFLLLVYLLKKFVWQGVIGALEKRETQIEQDKQRAQQARESAEQLQAELETKLNHVAQEAAKKMAEAVKIGQTQSEQLIAAAKESSERLLEQARVQIQAEKDQALAVIRGEIVRTAVLAAQQVVHQQINEASAREAVTQVLDEIKKK